MKPILKIVMLCTAFVTAGTSAFGDIIFEVSNNPQPNDEAVVFNGPGAIMLGNPVTGRTSQGWEFQFTSNETLISPASNRVEAVDQSFDSLILEQSSGALFQSAIFNLGVSSNGTVNLSVLDNFGQTFSQLFSVSGSGQNFFTLTSNATQMMQRVTITGNDLNRISHFRVGGAESGNAVATQVAEPSTALLLGSGLIFVVAIVRFRSWS